jgi:shikimate dehydrogenase
MTDIFDFKAKPTSYAVMGDPVKHSKSPEIHRLFAQQCGISMRYDRIKVDVGGFDQAVSHFSAHGGAGLNITVPFKVEAWKLCQSGINTLSTRADQAQAVNTLRFENDGSIFGDNTDGAGLVADLQNNIGFSIHDKTILIVGAGGAVRGVIGSLLNCGAEQITIANRTVEKADVLSERFGSAVLPLGLDRAADTSYELVINGTAASLEGRLPGIDHKCMNENTVVYDMMYGNQPTVFMQWAQTHGVTRTHDGLGMLVEQAAESFHLWHGKHPCTKSVIQALRRF